MFCLQRRAILLFVAERPAKTVDLANAADEQAMLDEIEGRASKIACDPQALAAYRAESDEIEAGFGAPIPEW